MPEQELNRLFLALAHEPSEDDQTLPGIVFDWNSVHSKQTPSCFLSYQKFLKQYPSYRFAATQSNMSFDTFLDLLKSHGLICLKRSGDVIAHVRVHETNEGQIIRLVADMERH